MEHETNENVHLEAMSTEEVATKRSIEEVDESTDVNERNKKLKFENLSKDELVPDSMTSIGAEKDDVTEEIIEKNGRKNNNIEDDAERKDENIKVNKQKINYGKKKKCVLLLSYSGSGYNGMQRNPGVKTIEEDLTNALFKARAISEDAARNYGKMSFQRCARTDKGVSAARQVVSLKHMVPYKELLPDINKHLEPQIRVFALKQVTRGFDCKSRCSSRTYEYLLPTFAFAPTFAHTTKSFRITDKILNELNDVLKEYVGTKNFHNFTSGKDFNEESAKRYIIKFHVADEPFVEKDMEFLVLQVQGQSFMQHQIRKMIGLVIAIMKNYTGLDALTRAFQQPKIDIPKAPGLGLVLDQVHFSSYNKKFGQDGFHEPLEWSECEDQIKDFKKKFIHRQIIETEATTNSMMRWCSNLSTHSYSNVGMVERQSKGDTSQSKTIAETSGETERNGEDNKDESNSTNESNIISCEPVNEENSSNCSALNATKEEVIDQKSSATQITLVSSEWTETSEDSSMKVVKNE